MALLSASAKTEEVLLGLADGFLLTPEIYFDQLQLVRQDLGRHRLARAGWSGEEHSALTGFSLLPKPYAENRVMMTDPQISRSCVAHLQAAQYLSSHNGSILTANSLNLWSDCWRQAALNPSNDKRASPAMRRFSAWVLPPCIVRASDGMCGRAAAPIPPCSAHGWRGMSPRPLPAAAISGMGSFTGWKHNPGTIRSSPSGLTADETVFIRIDDGSREAAVVAAPCSAGGHRLA
jgi:hypothetical protein